MMLEGSDIEPYKDMSENLTQEELLSTKGDSNDKKQTLYNPYDNRNRDKKFNKYNGGENDNKYNGGENDLLRD